MKVTSESSERLVLSVTVRILGLLPDPYMDRPDRFKESLRKIDGALLAGMAVAGRVRLKASFMFWELS